MANAIDRAMGIHERTSAEAASGAWYAGMPTVMGFLWAATVENERWLAFETAPGQVAFGFTTAQILGARRVAAGLNVIVEMLVRDNEGDSSMLTVIGPRGRVKNIFAFVGHSV